MKGRHCVICDKPGGHGCTTVLRYLGFIIPAGQIGYAHADCVAKRKRANFRMAQRRADNHRDF